MSERIKQETGRPSVPDEVAEAVEFGEDKQFRDRMSAFIDPAVKLSAPEQLAIMRDFWRCLGFEIPDLPEASLTRPVDTETVHRIVPSPLLDLDGRHDIVQRARVFSGSQFTNREDIFWTPSKTELHGRLLHNTDRSSIVHGNVKYGVRYMIAKDTLVDRGQYIDYLKASGQAVADDHGMLWTIPVTDVGVKAHNYKKLIKNLQPRVSPIVTPDLLLTTLLLHQAAGSPNREWTADLANEVVCRFVGRTDTLGPPIAATCVDWHPDTGRISLDLWDLDMTTAIFSLRDSKSYIPTEANTRGI